LIEDERIGKKYDVVESSFPLSLSFIVILKARTNSFGGRFDLNRLGGLRSDSLLICFLCKGNGEFFTSSSRNVVSSVREMRKEELARVVRV